MAARSALGAININGSEQKHHAICNASRGSKLPQERAGKYAVGDAVLFGAPARSLAI